MEEKMWQSCGAACAKAWRREILWKSVLVAEGQGDRSRNTQTQGSLLSKSPLSCQERLQAGTLLCAVGVGAVEAWGRAATYSAQQGLDLWLRRVRLPAVLLLDRAAPSSIQGALTRDLTE